MRTNRAWRFDCRVYVIAAVSVFATATGYGQVAAAAPVDARPASLFSAEYVRSLWHDIGGVLTDPAHWDESNWQTAEIWTGATLAAAGLDHDIRRQAQAHFQTRGEKLFFRDWEQLGAGYSFGVIGTFEVWGVFADNRNARDTAMDAVSASVIASGIIAPALKYTVGRYRPSQTSRTFKFSPFSGHQSFPSGHATQAWAVASVVAAHYQEWWQQSLAYGAATLVDVARVQQNAHFASDVVAGSAIGWAVGRAIVHRHETIGGFTLAPWFGNGSGLALSRTF